MEETLETVTSRNQVVLATEVESSPEGLWISTKDGRYFIRWEDCSPTLAAASELERSILRKSPSGYGIHWPLLDEDLAVGPLVEGRTPVPH